MQLKQCLKIPVVVQYIDLQFCSYWFLVQIYILYLRKTHKSCKNVNMGPEVVEVKTKISKNQLKTFAHFFILIRIVSKSDYRQGGQICLQAYPEQLDLSVIQHNICCTIMLCESNTESFHRQNQFLTRQYISYQTPIIPKLHK